MNPATTQPAPPSNGKSVSPADYVRSLSPEDKQDVFVTLLRELLARFGGSGLIPFEDTDGRFLGYYVPPAAANAQAEQMWAEMPEAVRQKFSRPVHDLDAAVSPDELLAGLTPAAGERRP